MKVCPECGYNNPETRDFCQECGRNLKGDLVKTTNKPTIKEQMLYKVDKKTGSLRVSKTKSFSLFSFTFTFLFVVGVGLFTPISIYGFIVVGILFGLLVALILYLIGYIIAGIIEKLNLD